MHRLSARTLWYANEAAVSFLGMLAFTVTAVYYVTEVGMSPLELVLVGTVMEVSIFVFEVPTGIVADVYSRRLSVITGTFVMGVAVILFGAFGDVWPILAANALWGFGYTFTSGASDAWLADEVGLIGNAFSIRAALAAGALCMAPALALYRRAARHGRLDA